jgi:hypothetical protein
MSDHVLYRWDGQVVIGSGPPLEPDVIERLGLVLRVFCTTDEPPINRIIRYWLVPNTGEISEIPSLILGDVVKILDCKLRVAVLGVPGIAMNAATAAIMAMTGGGHA